MALLRDGTLVLFLALTVTLTARAQDGCRLDTLTNLTSLTEVLSNTQAVRGTGDSSNPPDNFIVYWHNVVCLTTAQTRDQYLYASVVAEFSCVGATPTGSALGSMCSSENYTAQFDLQCGDVSLTWQTPTIVFGTADTFFNPADADFSTSRDTYCSFCVDPTWTTAPLLNVTIGAATHCAICHDSCLESPDGQELCYGVEAAQCCNVFEDGECEVSCSAGRQPKVDGAVLVCTHACDDLDAPTNGEVTYNQDGFHFEGTVATYDCDDGYSLGTPASATCQDITESSGVQWSTTDTPACTIVDCTTTGLTVEGVFPNGVVDMSLGTTFGQEAVYICENNYELDRNERRTCQADGTWNGSIPMCVRSPIPTNVIVSQLSTTTIRVSWSPPVEYTPTVTSYRVFYTVDGSMNQQVLGVSEHQWSVVLSEDQTYDIAISVQSLTFSVPRAEVTVAIPQFPSGSVSNLGISPTLSQINLTWTEIPVNSDAGVITRYEVEYPSSDDSPVATKVYIDLPAYVIRGRNWRTNYTVSVTPFSLFSRGSTEQHTVQTLAKPPQVQGVRVEVLSDTKVEVTWKSVPLPLEELLGYRVYYRQLDQRQEGQAHCVCEGFADFQRGVSSGEISGLTSEVTYLFQVAARGVTLNGTEVEGDASEVDSDSIVRLTSQDSCDSTISAGVLAGAIVGTFLITILLYSMALTVVHMVLRRSKATEISRAQAEIPLKSCVAYGEAMARNGRGTHIHTHGSATLASVVDGDGYEYVN